MHNARVTVLCAAAMVLGGCASLPNPVKPLQPQKPPVVAQQAPSAANGSLFIPGSHVSLFQDHKLWHVGDLVTIDITQNASASTNDGTSLNSQSSANLSVGTVLGYKPSFGGTSVSGGLRPEVNTSSSMADKGQGSNTASNSVTARITAMVAAIQANGVLEISGRTNINVDGDLRTIQVTGFVRPQDIGPDNTVSSDAIANANVQYVGMGPTQQAHHIPGGLRWLEKLWPF